MKVWQRHLLVQEEKNHRRRNVVILKVWKYPSKIIYKHWRPPQVWSSRRIFRASRKGHPMKKNKARKLWKSFQEDPRQGFKNNNSKFILLWNAMKLKMYLSYLFRNISYVLELETKFPFCRKMIIWNGWALKMEKLVIFQNNVYFRDIKQN